MTATFQASLLDCCDEVGTGPLGAAVRRTALGDGAWIDLRRGWVSGADTLFERLAGTVPWLDEIRAALNAHYEGGLGEPFRTAGLCFYRDGRDSVAWHGDRIGRGATQDTMVAIIVLGAPRALLLRPRGGGGAAIRHDLGHGDLLVMGGSCQRTWEHAVPKTARPIGPRISVQFRPR